MGEGQNTFRRPAAPVPRREEIDIRTLRRAQLQGEARRLGLSDAGFRRDIIHRIFLQNGGIDPGSYFFVRTL